MQMLAPIATPAWLPGENSMPHDPVMDRVELDEADEDQIDRDNVVQEPRHDENEQAGDDGNDRRDMGGGNDHDFFLWVLRGMDGLIGQWCETGKAAG
jgi:hypothetical protein